MKVFILHPLYLLTRFREHTLLVNSYAKVNILSYRFALLVFRWYETLKQRNNEFVIIL